MGRMRIDKMEVFKKTVHTFSWAMSVMRAFRVRFNAYILLVIIKSIYELYMMTCIKGIVDMALADNVGELIVMCRTVLVLYLGAIVMSLVADRFSAYNYNGMYNKLEMATYRKIMDASWFDLTEYHSGDLMTRLSSDVGSIARNTNSLIPALVSNAILIFGAGTYLLYLDYSMILVALAVALVILLASKLFIRHVYDSQKRIRVIQSRIASFHKETFNNMQAVKAFGLEEYFYTKMDDLEKQRVEADLTSNKYSLASWAITFLAGLFGGLVCIAGMFYRVHTGNISFGALSVMAFLGVQIGNGIKTLLHMIPQIMAYIASAERVQRLLELDDEEHEGLPQGYEEILRSAEENGVSVIIKDMCFHYKNGGDVFENVSMKARPGEIIALVGPSGEGKTTMLRILLGIVSANEGKIYAETGNQTINLGKNTRAMVSYVPQGNSLMAGTIRENMLMINPGAQEEDIRFALETACIYDHISQLPDGLDYVLGENASGFSEGQNQRLSIARALLKDAPIMLMDEATSALDVSTEQRVLRNIMRRDPRKTVILTTHRPTVLSMCDRVYLIKDKTIQLQSDEDTAKLMLQCRE